MSNATKAMLVLLGTVAFFMVPVIGPAIEGGFVLVVQTLLGVDAEAKLAQAKEPQYAGTPLGVERGCCGHCGEHWNYNVDRCDIESQISTACVRTCGRHGGAPEAPAAPGHH